LQLTEDLFMDTQKILHWIRQDNAAAWGRWVNTPAGKAFLTPATPWVERIWNAKAWKILDVWCDLDDAILGFHDVNVGEFVERVLPTLVHRDIEHSAKNSRVDKTAPSKNTWALYQRLCETAKTQGWTPSGHWGWTLGRIMDHDDVKLDWALNLMSSISPESPIKHSARSDLAPVVWLDWVLMHDAPWAEGVYWSLLKNHPRACQTIHDNWVEYVLTESSRGHRSQQCVRLFRVGEALASGLIQAPLPSVELLEKTLFWNRKVLRSSPDRADETAKRWWAWLERQKLNEKERAVLDNAPHEDRSLQAL
jgi:hypothetical protein